ncbi:aromatic-ring-hydroxylating dioxygenase subunit beta [Haloplanus halophilus]|uniref:aromatic-ring-hydroxylating dioxygenase subunit beta n=1 Tax=Haloplanus halophilus TaxID=2949993 RepID=UPI00203E3D51|nr:aromatic-ring-hydroxylating dioxygenase subunit beta [Haloplanus sp. GDY1]
MTDGTHSIRTPVREFLYREARTLDRRRYRRWVDEFLAEEVTYRVPTHTTQEKNTRSEFSSESWHFDDDRESLEVRIDRLENEYAWSANPPSRIRRFVSNVLVEPDGELATATDYLLVVRHDRDARDPTVLSAERHSTLRADDGGLSLARRRVLLDQTAIGVDHLPIL